MAVLIDTTPDTSGAVCGPPHPDAALVQIGAEAQSLVVEYEAAIRVWFDGVDKGDHSPEEWAAMNEASDRSQPASDRLDVLLEEAIDLPAQTLAGVKAKAILLKHDMLQMHCWHYKPETAHDLCVSLALSLASDLERLA